MNVASRCGLTPQYEGLEKLHEELSGKGFTVLGVPCNQFLGQEPGTEAEIAEFCSATYGVTFPMTSKVEVNGDGRHPLYDALTATPDEKGEAGDIQWNFEKFLVVPERRDRRPVPAADRARSTRACARPSTASCPTDQDQRCTKVGSAAVFRVKRGRVQR